MNWGWWMDCDNWTWFVLFLKLGIHFSVTSLNKPDNYFPNPYSNLPNESSLLRKVETFGLTSFRSLRFCSKTYAWQGFIGKQSLITWILGGKAIQQSAPCRYFQRLLTYSEFCFCQSTFRKKEGEHKNARC